ncbi:phosphohydrolase [Brachyspira hampsonii]|uniref:Phosphohydrolase n=1 Tax=Brachyspira hampsonii TaxID=1287055 RepID=A0A1E5NFF8_9SPIR|nr:phosphohydrolase [Brachyspira hampsonii]OEJ14878.1 phosphohydrolase [Brachyspira hampsonii]
MDIDLEKYTAIDINFIKENIDTIKFNSPEIICTSNDNLYLSIPNYKIDILFDKNSINSDIFNNFYITKNSKSIIDLVLEKNEKNEYKHIENINQFIKVYKDCMPDSENTKNFEYKMLEMILEESPKERFISIKNYIDILNQYYNEELYADAIKYILEIITRLAFIERINLIHLVNASKDKMNQVYFDDLEYYDTQIAANDLILSITKLVEKIYPNISLFYGFDNFDCRNVIGHGNRVFIIFIEFMLYYNEQIDNHLNLRTIINFNKKFKRFYENVFKRYKINKTNIKFNDIFKNGLKKISIENIASFAAGAFWHDVVKVKELDYLNINKSKEYAKEATSHAIKGYQFLKLFRNYNDNISLIVGMHHEYYGYGNNVIKMINKQFNENKDLNPSSLISDNSDDIQTLQSLAFFPAKVLEIIDLFDTTVMPQKNYSRKDMNAEDAVKLIYDNYIVKKTQLDPILFELFVDFLIDIKKENIKNPL